LVPFTQELDYIRAYLGIQSKRFKDLEIAIEDKVLDFKVPYNTIEPIVENSIENGALKSSSSGRFVLRSYERLDCYAVQIVDNGPGISPEKEFCGNTDYKTVKKRLKTMCQASIDVKCRPGKGAIITVKIPKDGYIIKE
jgi:sensor histidine kinase YesM